MDRDELSRTCAALHRRLSEEYYRAGAGLQEEMDTAAIFEAFPALTSRESVAAAARRRDAAPDDERREAAFLLEHLASLYERHRAREFYDRLNNLESAQTVAIDGETMPFRAVLPALMNEPDRARRLRLADARQAALAELEPVRLELHATLQAVARELGFDDHLQRCDRLGPAPLEPVAVEARRLLEATEPLYRRHLAAWIAAGGVAAEPAHWSDLAYLFRADSHDVFFAGERLLERMARFAGDLGVPWQRHPGLRLDLEERPLKSPRAFCVPVEAPRDVVLVVRPSGGLPDYAAFLHELGHALHFASAAPGLPWAFRHLGDYAVTEAYAFLFDHLTWHPGWLRRYVSLDEPAPLVYAQGLRTLMMVRRYSAQLLFELELFRGADTDPRPLADSWKTAMEDAAGVEYDARGYLASIDAEFYAARYLMGWWLEALLAERLATDHGDTWFTHPGAGQWLEGLWRRGQEPLARELFAELGHPEPTAQPLIDRLERVLESGGEAA